MIKIGEETLENGQIIEIFKTTKGGIIKTPKQEPQEPQKTVIVTKFQFLKRLTQEELVKISSPELFIQDVMTLAQVKAVLLVFNSANEINLQDDSLDGFKAVMAGAGLFTQERVDEITTIQ